MSQRTRGVHEKQVEPGRCVVAQVFSAYRSRRNEPRRGFVALFVPLFARTAVGHTQPRAAPSPRPARSSHYLIAPFLREGIVETSVTIPFSVGPD